MTAINHMTASTGLGRGISFALFSYGSFATADALIKTVSAQFSTFQIALFVAAFALIPALALSKGKGGWRSLIPRSRNLVLARAFLTSVCCVLVWTAFGSLPLAEAYAILFMAPLLVTAFSAVLLGEQVGWRRWLSTFAGFAGVMIILDPKFDTLGTGHALVGIAAFLGALSFLILRKIGKEEPSASILTTLFLALILISLAPAYHHWVQPSLAETGMMAMAGLLFGSAQAGLVLATREAPASLVAPFQYTQMVWAVVFGILLFGDLPSLQLMLGLSVVTASGLFTIWRETKRSRPVTMATGRGEVTARAARRPD